MRLSSPYSRHRLGAAVLGVSVMGALLAPIAAAADEPPLAVDDPSPEISQEPVVPQDLDVPSPDDVVDEVLDDNLIPVPHEPPGGPQPDHDPGDITGDITGDPACTVPLAVISWNRASDAGEMSAVAITAQLLEVDLAGWASASWQAAPGTTLTAVTARHIDGGLAELPPTPTGTTTNVVEFIFCGTTTAPEPRADAPPEAAAAATCHDLLAVATPERVEGDDRAVAITAQTLESGVPGWSNVGWEPAAGTTLRTVFVTGTDGTVTEAGRATSATAVASLTFCGNVEHPADEAPPTSGPTTLTSSGRTASPGTPSTPGSPAISGSGATETPDSLLAPDGRTTDGRPPDGSPADEPPPDEPAAQRPVGTATAAGTPHDTDVVDTELDVGDTEDTDHTATDEETDVMGIQLTREEEPDGSGRYGAGSALLAATALLATAGDVLWSRRS